MYRACLVVVAGSICAGMLSAADGPKTPTVASSIDGDIKSAEREIVSLAEAVPADKYAFAPTAGEFKGVRTFGAQMKHIATVVYSLGASLLNEKAPVDLGDGDNGPVAMTGKDDIVSYLKGSFVYAHKAVATLTTANALEIGTAFGNEKMARLQMATIITWHSFDHYGQAVVYARMNGIIPPASKQ